MAVLSMAGLHTVGKEVPKDDERPLSAMLGLLKWETRFYLHVRKFLCGKLALLVAII